MQKWKIISAAGLIALFALQPSWGQSLDAKWSKGIRLESADGDVKLKFGGRIMNDWGFFTEDDSIGEVPDAVEFRRARLYLAGTIYENVEFKAQYDFAGGDADFKDMYLGLKGLGGVGKVKVGHFKEPFGLEEQTSSKYITFMERSLATGAFSPSRNVGIRANNDALEERLTWSIGLFSDTDGYGEGEGNGNFNVTGRITFLPWSDDDNLAHVGVAYSYRNPTGDSVRYRSRPESHIPTRYVDTGSITADDVNLLGVEGALVFGPGSIQAEYLTAMVGTPSGSADPDFSGFYVQGSYFLTGESRAYKGSAGAFSRVSPENDLGDGGYGALELAVRYSQLDLNDGAVVGGEESNITVGLNWHLNPNVRVMMNYVRAEVEDVATGDPQGDLDAFMLRFQIDF